MLGTSGSHPCGFCGFQMQDVRFPVEACWRLTLFAFDKGEDVSEESYFGDTLYMCVEGVVIIKLQEKTIRLREGEVFMVKSEKLHAVSGEAAFKMLQITLNNN